MATLQPSGEFLESEGDGLRRRFSEAAGTMQVPDHLETGSWVLGNKLRKNLPVIKRIHFDVGGTPPACTSRFRVISNPIPFAICSCLAEESAERDEQR